MEENQSLCFPVYLLIMKSDTLVWTIVCRRLCPFSTPSSQTFRKRKHSKLLIWPCLCPPRTFSVHCYSPNRVPSPNRHLEAWYVSSPLPTFSCQLPDLPLFHWGFMADIYSLKVTLFTLAIQVLSPLV